MTATFAHSGDWGLMAAMAALGLGNAARAIHHHKETSR